MSTREEFEKWFQKTYPMNSLLVDDFNSHLWMGWQAAAEASDAKWQAKMQRALLEARIDEMKSAEEAAPDDCSEQYCRMRADKLLTELAALEGE